MQVRPTRFRVPDVCVVAATDPAGDVVTTAPALCIEVLSPDDTLLDMHDRVEDYMAMGVQNVWIFDPVGRRIWSGSEQGLRRIDAPHLVLAGSAVRLSVAEIFAELDELTRTNG